MTNETLKITGHQRMALERLIGIARSNTGQSRKVANFLLAWWNAQECGGFDLTDVWNLDRTIAEDMLTVFGLLTRCIDYPDTLGYGSEFTALIRAWRPSLAPPDQPVHSSPSTEM
jgi:hypothetical protein